MAAKVYATYNYVMPTTGVPAPVTSGTAIKTLLQLAMPSTEQGRVIEWGITFDGVTPANVPGTVELIETDVAATVTAHVAAGLVKQNAPNDVPSLATLGTAATGYTASAEGSITATRTLDVQQINPTAAYFKQFPLGREPEINASKFLRIRVKFAVAVNCLCYIIWEE